MNINKLTKLLTILFLILSHYLCAENVELTIKTIAGEEKKTLQLAQCEGFLRLEIPVKDLENVQRVNIQPEFAKAKVGDEGYIVSPNSTLTEYKKRDKNARMPIHQPSMPICGMKTPNKTFMAIVTGMEFDYFPIVTYENGNYTLSHTFDLTRYKPYENIVIDYYYLTGKDANYSGIGRLYRSMLLETIKPIKDRVNSNKYLQYAAESIEFRIRQGWKPAPSPVRDQTLQNEPQMYAKVTFDRVGEILDALKTRGVEKAQITLVGWNRKGHDGRYPQIFPVEPQLGGESKLRELIKKAKSMGYQIACHTNPTSCYPVSELWDESYVAKTNDGTTWERPIKQPWSGGRSYFMCMQTSFEQFAKKDFPKMRELGFEGLHYLDVVSIVSPQICYDKNHKCNAKESAFYCNELMRLAGETFGGAQSEGGYYHVAKYTDYALYSIFRHNGKLVDKVVPLWQIAFHGLVLSNPMPTTVNYTAKGQASIMKLLEFGGRPTFYMYSEFFEDGKKKNWMGDTDLRCGNQKEFDHAIDCLAQGYNHVKELSYLQYEFLDEHKEIAKDVFKCTYSDGSIMLFNYSDKPFIFEGKTIQSMSYKLEKPKAWWDIF